MHLFAIELASKNSFQSLFAHPLAESTVAEFDLHAPFFKDYAKFLRRVPGKQENTFTLLCLTHGPITYLCLSIFSLTNMT